MLKKYVTLLIAAFSLAFPSIVFSDAFMPPLPYRISGTVTINGEQLSHENDAGYTFKVTTTNGTDYSDFMNFHAEDTDGLSTSDRYLIDIPIYDADSQPYGASPGDIAIIHIYKYGSELELTSPSGGQITIDESQTLAEVNLMAEFTTGTLSPSADAGQDQTVREGETVTLDGSGSADLDGSVLSYFWEQTDGFRITLSDTRAVQPSFEAPEVESAGASLTFRLTVTDNDELEDTAVCVVNVRNTVFPIADAGQDQTVSEGNTVMLDGSSSADPDGSVISYHWEQTEGPQITLSDALAAAPSFKAPNVEEDSVSLTFMLTVTDNDGLENAAICVVDVRNTTIPNLSVTPLSQNLTEAGQTITFEVSNIGEGTMSWKAETEEEYSWLAIDGENSGANSGIISVSCNANDGNSRIGKIKITADALNSPEVVEVNQEAGLGDIDHSGIIDLKDVILTLKTLAGSGEANIHTDKDVNHDGKIGIENAIYVLRIIAE